MTGYPDECVLHRRAHRPHRPTVGSQRRGHPCRAGSLPLQRPVTTTAVSRTGYRYPGAGYTVPHSDHRQPVLLHDHVACSSALRVMPTAGARAPARHSGRTTNRYISYGAGGFDPAAFTRVDITTFAGTNAYGRTFAQEMANFAKWYAFARTRILAMKTAGGIAFSALDANSRVGFHTLNSFATKFLDVQDFTDANKITWFTNFYSVVPARRNAIDRSNVANRRIFFESRRSGRAPWRDRSAEPGLLASASRIFT